MLTCVLPCWSVHAQVGQWLALDLEVSCSSVSTSSGTACGHDPLQLQVNLFAVDASSAASAPSGHPGTPTGAGAAAAGLDRGSSHVVAMLAGHSFLSRSSAAANTPTAADAAAAAALQLVDPGVFLMGCFGRQQISITPGSKQTCRLQALLVQPGLYVFGVASVQLVGGQAISSGDGAAGITSAGQAPGHLAHHAAEKAAIASGRVFCGQDRLYVLVAK